MSRSSTSTIAASFAALLLMAGPAVAQVPAAPPTPPPPPPVPLAPPAPGDALEWPELSRRPRTIEEGVAGPEGELPPAPPRGVGRSFNAAVSVGPGWLALQDSLGRDGQSALAFAARLGVVVAPDCNVFIGADRASTGRGGATFAQTAALLGVQRFFVGRIYAGAAAGLAWVAEYGVPDGLTDGPSWALSAAIGVEAFRVPHVAFTAEVAATVAWYTRERWDMGGMRLGLVAF